MSQYLALPGGPTAPDTSGDQQPVTPPPPGRRHPGRPGPGPALRHQLYGRPENFPGAKSHSKSRWNAQTQSDSCQPSTHHWLSQDIIPGHPGLPGPTPLVWCKLTLQLLRRLRQTRTLHFWPPRGSQPTLAGVLRWGQTGPRSTPYGALLALSVPSTPSSLHRRRT